MASEIASVPVKLPGPEGTQFTADEAPLDEKYYLLEPASIEFFSQQTGIKDPEEMKRHILEIQKEAYAVHPYPCIRRFSFVSLKISRLPGYQALLKLGRERAGALFLDIGCCVGTDIRKAIADGFPMTQALGSDLHPEFWDIGHKLYRSTKETFPVPFIPGDAFDDTFLAPAPLPTTVSTEPLPDLSTLTSLNPLSGRLSAIHASAFFHLFNEEKQLDLAKRLAALLSPESGSMLFGVHVSRPEKGVRVETFRPNSHGTRMFCHSPESWKELWEKEVFSEGQVEVVAKLVEIERLDLPSVPGTKFWMMPWSVTRL